MAQKLSTEEEKNNFYTQIKSAAESGWDFSSRWFISAQKSNRGEYLNTINDKAEDKINHLRYL